MRIFRRRPKRCPATLGATLLIDGREWQCERKRHRDPEHERWSAPARARWTDLNGGGVSVEFIVMS